MGRAPNSGAPQRVSNAHVVPKVQAFNEEEKTTIESDGEQVWEEEPSTTVEQGEVAARIQQLGNPRTNVTNTNGDMLDEPTVDDRGANPSAVMTPAQLTVQARLVITAGNDTGQELTVAPGKSYTIGRALDNDLALTDLAVSRKHFDLRYEGGAWVIADRGSGNGTLVNGNIEDAPYLLANGDNIEIGNTQFRIDIPNSPPRGSNASIQTMDAGLLEDMSTNSGAQFNIEAPTTRAAERRPLTARPLTSPSPRMPTPRPGSVPPPNNPPRLHASPTLPPLTNPMPHTTIPPGSTTPMRPNAYGGGGAPGAAMRAAGNGRVPGVPGGPIAPMGQQRPMGQQISPGALAGNPMMLDGPIGMAHTTLPGTGAPIQPSMPSMPARLPSSSGMDRANSAPLIIGPNGTRDATSTALVQPTPYAMMPMATAPVSLRSTLSKKTKLVIAGVGGALVLAIIIAVAASGSDSPTTSEPAVGATDSKVEPKAESKDQPKDQIAPLAATPTDLEKSSEDTQKKADEEARLAAEAEQKRIADEQKAADAEQKRIADAENATRKTDETEKRKTATAEKKRIADEKKAADAEKKRIADAERKRIADEKKAAKKDPPATKAQPKTVAFDASGAKKTAENQYRAKDFLTAGKTLSSAASSSSGDDARDLKQLASIYTQLGKAYNVGSAPGTKPTEAWDRLGTALKLDGSVGKAHSSELRGKLAAIAPKAAAGFMSAKDFTKARSVVVFAEANGARSSTITAVKGALESEAGKLYRAAQELQKSDTDAAKQKYRQIQAMVDSKSSWYQKAGKALAN